MVGKSPLIAKDILEILGVRGNLHSIEEWYVAIKLLSYLDKLAELLVGHRLPSPL